MNCNLCLRSFIFPLVLLGSVAFVSAQETEKSELELRIEKADQIAQQKFVEEDFPGMAVVVAIDGKVIWSKGYGFSDLGSQKPVDPSTSLFRIGSISKTLSASALGQLIETSAIDPNAEIQEYVPDFPRKEYPITVAQVAGHIAGIRHYLGPEFMMNKHYSDVHSSLEIFKDSPLLFEPGTKYSYSSYGWNLISAVIEAASGTPFLDYMQSMVFEQAGMKHTHPEFKGQHDDEKVTFYVKDGTGKNVEGPEVDNSYKWAGGGFIGTATDLILFANAVQKEHLFSNSTFNLLTTSQVLSDGSLTNYGMGWRLGKDKDAKSWVGHSGGSVGGTSMFLMYPDSRVTVVALVNLSSAKLNDLAWQIAEPFLDWNDE